MHRVGSSIGVDAVPTWPEVREQVSLALPPQWAGYCTLVDASPPLHRSERPSRVQWRVWQPDGSVDGCTTLTSAFPPEKLACPEGLTEAIRILTDHIAKPPSADDCIEL
jgi:hypothetical protein